MMQTRRGSNFSNAVDPKMLSDSRLYAYHASAQQLRAINRPRHTQAYIQKHNFELYERGVYPTGSITQVQDCHARLGPLLPTRRHLSEGTLCCGINITAGHKYMLCKAITTLARKAKKPYVSDFFAILSDSPSRGILSKIPVKPQDKN
jgi:hypothetical protein